MAHLDERRIWCPDEKGERDLVDSQAIARMKLIFSVPMPKPFESDPSARAAAIARALEAAQRNDRDAFLGVLEGIVLSANKSSSIDERWLAAELAFRRGQYPRAIELFEAFERDPRSAKAAPWQRYRSSHRRAFSYLHQGDDERSWQALREAEERLRLLPELGPEPPDLHAMHGHLLNHRGDFERARARFALGYERAVATEKWSRAAGDAADVSMMLFRLNRLTEAREWLDRAEEALQRGPNSLVAATIAVRRGHVYRAMEMDDEAEAQYQRVIEGPQPHPDPLEAAYRGRAEVRLGRRDFDGAESDLRTAVSVCLAQGLRGHAAAVYRDLANLYLARGKEGDEHRAVNEFRRALGLLFTLRPPRPDMLMDFADEIVRRPALVGSLREEMKVLIREQVEQLRTFSQPHPFTEAARASGVGAGFRSP